ncbi:phage regulatory CII family protein [Chenggangzhangella methanolivorans]|uniref:Uncharacterized protein n=1 Tax=Chenggangzhangella methanolivorans TaxID=1437009 RepID=A0A9E6R8H7_9HYPH|nr:phage regulatory CII family protein [Chenggangzhangella methanolivorans]QZN99769.1 hypothetical protein K6K41_24395 [Chenggangzhangella methanolivorans]
MTGARQLPERDYLALKAETRALVKRCGGQEAAAASTRVSHQALSRYGALEDAPNFAPIDVVADLEAEIGEPVVSRALAGLLGFTLVKVEAGAQLTPAQRFARVMKETHEVNAAFADALSDGAIDEAERRAITREARDAIGELERLIVALNLDAPQ